MRVGAVAILVGRRREPSSLALAAPFSVLALVASVVPLRVEVAEVLPLALAVLEPPLEEEQEGAALPPPVTLEARCRAARTPPSNGRLVEPREKARYRESVMAGPWADSPSSRDSHDAAAR